MLDQFDRPCYCLNRLSYTAGHPCIVTCVIQLDMGHMSLILSSIASQWVSETHDFQEPFTSMPIVVGVLYC